MSRPPRDVEKAVLAAAACAFVMIASQVAGKATRDALFLSSHEITALPRVVVGCALVSIGAVLAASRLLAAVDPARLLPIAFLTSSATLIGLAVLAGRSPGIAAVGVYLHFSVFGAILISWFWSMLNEALDPNTARKRMGRIATGATLGGLLGGLGAERVAAHASLAAMLPLLAGLHAVCAALARAAAVPASPVPHPRAAPGRSGMRVLSEVPYLRDLAALVLVVTVCAELFDYVFKDHASRTYAGEELLRFFGLFYAASGLLTFLLQSVVTKHLLARGLAPAAATLPGLVIAGGGAALLVPGLAAASAVRGLEAALRSSVFRSSYELLYSPVRREDKRAAKTIVDVGFDRLGDAVGGALIQLVLLAGVAVASGRLLVLAAILGFIGLFLARRLHHGYVAALERSLLDQGGWTAARAAPADDEASRSTFLQTVAHLDMSGPVPDAAETAAGSVATAMMSRTAFHALPALEIEAARTPGAASPPAPAPASAPAPADPIVRAVQELKSGDVGRVRRALAAGPLPAPMVGFAIDLLAWDAVAPDALRALRAVCDRHTGQLSDALLNPETEFAIRRRVAQVFSAARQPRAVNALLGALDDPRFEVRFQAGAALARVRQAGAAVAIPADAVLAKVEREARVNRQVWESQRLLDDTSREESPFHDEVLRARSSRSLEHVFNMLSVVFPAEPLRIAYRGLHADDRTLRGTALEYLEHILPPNVRECLWPFLDDDRAARDTSRGLEQIVDDLVRSHESIQIHLDRLRRPGN